MKLVKRSSSCPHRTWSAIIAALLALAAPAAAAPAGSTLLVSRPDGFGPAPAALDGSSVGVALSDDGRYAVFDSVAASAQAPSARRPNLFLRDTVTGTTTLVNRSDGADGEVANATGVTDTAAVAVEPGAVALDPPHDQPHVLVAFSTAATNLADHFTGPAATGGVNEVWLRDVTAGTTYLVSRGDGLKGAPANGRSDAPSLAVTDHGPVVAFSSYAASLGAVPSVYLRAVRGAQTLKVACHQQDCGGRSAAVAAWPSVRFVTEPVPSLCATGFRCVLVAFATDDQTLTGDPSGQGQVVVASATEGSVTTGAFDSWVTASKADGSGTTFGNDGSFNPSLGPDGRAVAFISSATNLVAGTPNGMNQAFVRSLDGSGATMLVSRDSAGHVADGPSYDVALSNNGIHGRATFTADSNFGARNLAGLRHAWERDLNTGTTELLDRGAGVSGAPGEGDSGQAGISADGARTLFWTTSHNLGAGGGIDFGRAYVRDLGTETLELVSRPDGSGPFPTGVRDSTIARSAVSADGRYVAFQSNTDGLASGEDNRFRGVFVRDLLAGTTTLVSRANGADGVAANDDATLNGISDDGRRVLFTTDAANMIGGPATTRAYVRDLGAATTTVASRANGPTGTITSGTGAAISGDGNRVVFLTSRPVDPDAAPNVTHVYVRDLAAQTTTFVDRDNGPAGLSSGGSTTDAVIDRDGGRVAWTTTAPLAGAPFTFNIARVYERDLRADTTTLVSRAEGANGVAANADATAPAIDAAGDVIAFQSASSNLGAPVTAEAVWVRDIPGAHLQLASRATGAAGAVPDGPATAPSIDGSGDRVAFRSRAGNLGSGLPASLIDWHAYVRDIRGQSTELASRANGPAGAPIDSPGPGSVSLSANGDCVAFDSTGLNVGDGFDSIWFPAVHLRVLRHECPISPPGGAITTASPAHTPKAPQPPVLSALRLVPKQFAVAPRTTARKRRQPRSALGSSIRFRLTISGRVMFSFAKQLPGRRSGKRCLPARGHVPRRKRCTRLRNVGSVSRDAKGGANRIAFSGRIRGRALALGSYRLTAIPLSASHQRGRARRAPFKIIAPR